MFSCRPTYHTFPTEIHMLRIAAIAGDPAVIAALVEALLVTYEIRERRSSLKETASVDDDRDV